jgi:hypothetical protein
MAITYTWSFPQLDIIYSEGEYSNVVNAVHWIYQAQDGNYYESMCGCAPLLPPSGQFIDYNDLTPEIVTGWVTEKLGQEEVDRMSADLATRIEAAKAPKGGAVPPPWAS